MATRVLSVGRKLGFGICDMGGNLFFTVISFLLLNFLTDTVGIAAGLASMIIVVGKIWNAVIDPITGYLSDRSKSRLGRRRSFILYGSLPLFITMFLMFTTPGLQSQTELFLWGVGVFCLLSTASTLVIIPYNALTPELTKDFHERTELSGYRFVAAVIGTLLGAGASLPLIKLFEDRTTGYQAMGAVFGFIMMATALTTVLTVREPERLGTIGHRGFFQTYAKVFRNRPFLIILWALVFHLVAITLISGIAIYYFKYIHNAESKTTIALLILLATAMFFIPVSVVLSKKIGKKAVYAAGMCVLSIAVMILFFWGHKMPVGFSLAMMLLGGIGTGLIFAMPHAIIPDAVEYDYLLTGERTAGAYYGIQALGVKLGQALAFGITGLVLSLTEYVPDVPQTESARLGIRLLLGPIPAGIFLISIAILYFYPINERRYREMLLEIEQMGRGGKSS